MLALIKPLEWFNDMAGYIGRQLSVFAMGLMVVIILTQVFFRYVLNNARPWPDEAARFLMLWLAGLMGPIALRQGSMVAIDGIQTLLPGLVCKLLIFFLLLVSMMVLLVAVRLALCQLLLEAPLASDRHESGEDQAGLGLSVLICRLLPDVSG